MARWSFPFILLLLLSPHYCVGLEPAGNNAAMPSTRTYEQHKQIAIRVNDLAGRIHLEADANALVSEIADLFAERLPPVWAGSGIQQRVAHAEYEALREPAKLISEQRLADVWNQYAREIGAPDEAIVSAAEIHNMRDANFTVARLMWARGNQTIWTMPNVYALGPDGKVAQGCRALDALRVIHDLDELFQNLLAARDRLGKGVVASDMVKKVAGDAAPQQHGAARLEARTNTNPLPAAEQRYMQQHGSAAYSLLLKRLFDELFPPE